MEYVFVIMAVLAVAHFVYEGMIAPSLRMQCRNDLFKQRDALRRLKIDNAPDADQRAHAIIHQSINGYLVAMSGVTIHFIWRVRRGVRSGKHLKETQERLKALQECDSQCLKEIGRSTGSIIERAFVINSFGWAFYVVPIAALLFTLHALSKAMTKIVALPFDWTMRLLQKEANLTEIPC